MRAELYSAPSPCLGYSGAFEMVAGAVSREEEMQVAYLQVTLRNSAGRSWTMQSVIQSSGSVARDAVQPRAVCRLPIECGQSSLSNEHPFLHVSPQNVNI